MSDCPRDLFNCPMCLIVDHPERNYKFCATCKKRFVDEDASGWSLLLTIVIVIVAVVLMNIYDRRKDEKEERDASVRFSKQLGVASLEVHCWFKGLKT